MTTQSVSRRRSLLIWGLFCAVTGIIFLVYTLSSVAVGRGSFVMPLDDAYIHFQYARQIAAGQPYVYNPGLPPSSGATSFLYPYILATGYLLGFQGLNLGLWAMSVGALALLGSLWLVYKLVTAFGASYWLGVGIALTFAVSGPISWHFMSGMETGLVVLFTLGTIYALISYFRADLAGQSFRDVVIWATLIALIRPEGAMLTLLTVAAVAWQFWRANAIPRRKLLWLLIPVLALGVQPAVNLALTGSAVASGNSAKSIFGTVPFYWDQIIGRVLGNFAQMWAEFFTGIAPHEGMYILPLMLILSLAGLIALLVKQQWRWVGLVVLGWLLGGTLLVSTLDTAFWHFKRYQMPFLALLFPLAGWGVEAISRRLSAISKRDLRRGLSYAVVGLMGITAIWTAEQFLRYYALNVDYIYLQPLQMARWLQANTPPDATVAVHDTGLIRYLGGRTTIDIVGLTTPGAADYWRNGPGSVAEFLMDKRPDYIAAYGPGHGLGLGMIADTSIYGPPLASFPVILDDNANVALAANFQGIYKPDWAAADHAGFIQQPNIMNYLKELTGYPNEQGSTRPAILRYVIDVADLKSERIVDYEAHDADENNSGFPTEVHEQDYPNCQTDCPIVDGGRLINGEEAFTLWSIGFDSSNSSYVILITRVHPANAGTFDVYAGCDDSSTEAQWRFVATRTVPTIPGQWLDIPTLIQVGGGCSLRVRIVPHIPGGYYMPYRHWVYEGGQYQPESLSGAAVATFQNGAIELGKPQISYDAGMKQAAVNLDWYTDGSAQGDYKIFVHLYQDVNQPPVAQTDTYPGSGTLPPGDWLPGVLHDTITVDLKNVPPGKYQVAIGMYNPNTNERLQPTGGDAQGRLFIGAIEIK